MAAFNRNPRLFTDYEDTGDFGQDQLGYGGYGIASLPIQQPITQPVPQPIAQPIYIPPAEQPVAQETAVQQPVVQQPAAQPLVQPAIQQAANPTVGSASCSANWCVVSGSYRFIWP